MNRFMGRSVATVMVGLVATMALSSCSSGSRADPATVLKDYVAALNAGDLQDALSLVSEPGEITADRVLNPGNVEIPVPLASDEAPGPETEVADLKFDFSGEQKVIEFVKSAGEWKLRNPEFLNHPEPSSNTQALIDLGAMVELTDGGDPFEFAYVLYDHASVPVQTRIVSEWFDPFEIPDTALLLETESGADLEIGGDSEQAFETPISEALRQNLIEEYDGVAWSNGNDTVSELLEFPEAAECTVRISSLMLLGGHELETTPACTGGLMRLTVENEATLRLDSNSEWKEVPAGRSVEGAVEEITAYVNLITGTVDARSVRSSDELWAELLQ